LIRQAMGQLTIEEPGWDPATVTAVVRNNRALAWAHEFGLVEGDLYLMVADRNEPAAMVATDRWEARVTGRVVETRLPCTHDDITRPDMLKLMWEAVSRLGLDIAAPSTVEEPWVSTPSTTPTACSSS
jgi:hypothetical protein